LERIRDWITAAKSVAALTGAGISAESGIPTFRGAGGLWRQYRAEDLATPEAFARDPKLVWEWYDWRRGVIAGVEPNAGHRALAELGRRVPDFSLITQNVDGLHDRAGSTDVLKSTAISGRCAVPCAGGSARIFARRFRICRRAAPAAAWSGRAWCGSVKRCPAMCGRARKKRRTMRICS